MLSVTCKAAIRAVVFLATRFGENKNAGIKEIASEIDASEHTVGKLLQTLVKAAIINSVKGPTGGFYITKQQLNFPVMRIVEAIDGKEIFKACGLGLSRCSSKHPCPIHDDYKQGRDLIEIMCNERKIMELCEPVHQGLAHLAG